MKTEDCVPAGKSWIFSREPISTWPNTKSVKPQLKSVRCYEVGYGPVFGSTYSQHADVRELDTGEFNSLVEAWIRDTRAFSSIGDIVAHDAYQRIMAAGKDALPFILSDLAANPRHWFHALTNIVGRDVAVDAPNFRSARAAWLEWGYKNNYI